jgi:hypothetical protein
MAICMNGDKNQKRFFAEHENWVHLVVKSISSPPGAATEKLVLNYFKKLSCQKQKKKYQKRKNCFL